MIAVAQLDHFIMGLANVKKTYPFEPTTAVYKVGDTLFALIAEDSNPVRLSLRCDPLLAQTLRAKYESVLPGQNLNPNQWNTVVCSGQLTDDELYDLVRHAYSLIEPAA